MNALPAELAQLPSALRVLLEAELAAGNQIATIENGFPAPPVGFCVYLTQTISCPADPSLRYREWPNWNRASGYSDAQEHFFLLNPSRPAPPDPVMHYDAEGAWVSSKPVVTPPLSTTNATANADSMPLQRFIASMEIDYEKWHDGIGYDLDTLCSLEGEARQQAEALLLARAAQDWRDIEALAALDSPRAQQALREALHSPKSEIALAVTHYAPHLVTDAQRTANLVTALETAEFYHGLSQAMDQAATYHPPEVLAALWRGVLTREGGIAVSFAALLMYIHGQASSRFDMEQRPYFLRFNTPDMQARAQLVAELRQRLQSTQE